MSASARNAPCRGQTLRRLSKRSRPRASAPPPDSAQILDKSARTRASLCPATFFRAPPSHKSSAEALSKTNGSLCRVVPAFFCPLFLCPGHACRVDWAHRLSDGEWLPLSLARLRHPHGNRPVALDGACGSL